MRRDIRWSAELPEHLDHHRSCTRRPQQVYARGKGRCVFRLDGLYDVAGMKACVTQESHNDAYNALISGFDTLTKRALSN
jgi:hypothetical protein